MAQIRLFEEKDAEKTADMITESLLQIHSEDLPASAIEALEKTYSPKGLIDIANNRKFFLAEISDEIAGTITVDLNNLATLFISPSFRNNGIKKELLEYAEKLVKNQNYSHIKISSSISDLELLKDMGYQKDSDIEFAGKIVSYMMVKAF